jgi:hypothetical protein
MMNMLYIFLIKEANVIDYEHISNEDNKNKRPQSETLDSNDNLKIN